MQRTLTRTSVARVGLLSLVLGAVVWITGYSGQRVLASDRSAQRSLLLDRAQKLERAAAGCRDKVGRGELNDCKVEITFQGKRLVSPSEAESIAASLRRQANLLDQPEPTPSQSTLPRPSATPSDLHWEGDWKSEEKEVVERLLKGIKHAGLKNWIAANIKFNRTSVPSSLPWTSTSDMIGVSPPSLNFKDRFFFTQITDGNGIQLAGNRLDQRRMNLLAFEAGKAFYGVMQKTKLPDGESLANWFKRYEGTHRTAIETTATIPYGDDSLENVYDPAIDWYSGFGYLFRMQALGLGAPPDFQERVNWLLQSNR